MSVVSERCSSLPAVAAGAYLCAVDSYQQSLQPAGLHASIHLAYGRRSIAHSPRRPPETEALSRVRISGITLHGGCVFVLGGRVSGRVLSEHCPGR